MLLAQAAATSSSSIPAWAFLLFGGLGVAMWQSGTKWFNKNRKIIQSVKDEPVKKDSEAIGVLQKDIKDVRAEMAPVTAWLMGNKNPFTGEYVGDGFKDTYPTFQASVKEGMAELKTLIIVNGNGNGKA